jgi:hypothetical protein
MEQGGMMLGHAVNNSIVTFRGVCCPSALCNRNMTLGEVQICDRSTVTVGFQTLLLNAETLFGFQTQHDMIRKLQTIVRF